MDKSGKAAALRELLSEVRGWKKDSLREKAGKPQETVEIEDGKEMVEEPREESDKEHDILQRLVELLGRE